MRAWRSLALVAAAALGARLATGCSSGVSVSYSGSERPVVVAPEEVDLFKSARTPDDHSVIGVVTARCETFEGTTGLAGEPCNEEAMLDRARRRASEAGGSALLDLRCDRRLLSREMYGRDGGGADIRERHELVCQATVARREGGARPRPQPSAAPAGRSLAIDGVEVAVELVLAEGQAPRPAREVGGVGELSQVSGVVIGEIHAECRSECGPNTARQAIKRVAAEVGALAVAALRCEPTSGGRWQCHASAVDEGAGP